MSVETEEQDGLDAKLRMLPAIDPPADLARRTLQGSPRPGTLPLGPRVVLVLTVLVYLGWAFRSASLLAQ